MTNRLSSKSKKKKKNSYYYKNKEDSVDSFYTDLKRYPVFDKATMHQKFVELRQADRTFWETVLCHCDEYRAFWMFELATLTTTYGKIVNHKASNEELAHQIAKLDGSHIFWSHVLKVVKSQKIPEGFPGSQQQFTKYSKKVIEQDLIVAQLRNVLVNANLRFAVSRAATLTVPYYTPKVWFADAIQESCLGIIAAVNRFDPDKGFAFTTYAHHWINNGIKKYSISTGNTVRRSPVVAQLSVKVAKVTNKHKMLYNRVPTDKELCAETGVTQKVLSNMKAVTTCGEDSFSVPIVNAATQSDISGSYQDFLKEPTPSPDIVLDQRTSVLTVQQMVVEAKLSDVEKHVVFEMFGFLTGEAKIARVIGKDIGRSKQRVLQIRDGALQKIAKVMAKRNLNSSACFAAFQELEERLIDDAYL